MMVSIPDDLYEKYKKTHLADKTTTEVLVKQLEKYSSINPNSRVIILQDDHRVRIEKLLPGGHIADAIDLVKKVERFASIRIGDVDIPLSQGERLEIATRAKRNNRTVEDELKMALSYIRPLLFHGLNG